MRMFVYCIFVEFVCTCGIVHPGTVSLVCDLIFPTGGKWNILMKPLRGISQLSLFDFFLFQPV